MYIYICSCFIYYNLVRPKDLPGVVEYARQAMKCEINNEKYHIKSEVVELQREIKILKQDLIISNSDLKVVKEENENLRYAINLLQKQIELATNRDIHTQNQMKVYNILFNINRFIII